MVTVKGSLLSFLIVTTSVFLITAPLHSVQAQNTGKQKNKKTDQKKLSDVRVDRSCISGLAKMQRPKRTPNLFLKLGEKT